MNVLILSPVIRVDERRNLQACFVAAVDASGS